MEVESGSRENRPHFAAALALAKRARATILVSKLDRLSWDGETICALMKRASFRVASMPQADAFQLHLFAALTEQERASSGPGPKPRRPLLRPGA